MPTADPTLSKSDVNEKALAAAADPTTTTSTGADNTVESPEGAHEDSQFVEQDFYNIQDGLRGRSGGVYLDQQLRVDAEELRAKSENRKPDFKNPPAQAGTTLVTEDRRVDNVYSNPSSLVVAPVKEVGPVATLPVDIGVAQDATNTEYAEPDATPEDDDTTPPVTTL